MAYSDQFKRASMLGAVLHHLGLAKKRAEEAGTAEIQQEIAEVEESARLERQLVLDTIAEGD